MGRFSGRVALVTGASRGIGRAIALRLASEGADIAVNYRTDQEAASEAARAMEAFGVRCALVQGDVGLAADAAGMVATCIAELGSIHVLVNNAGVSADMLTMRLGE